MPKLPPPPRIAQIEIRVLVSRCAADRAVCHHHFRGLQVVEREAVLRHQPTEAAAERQAGDAGRADHAAGRRETVELRLAIELLPQHAALGPRRSRGRIDVNAFHRREIDHQAAVDGSASADVVATAANGDFEAERARELDGIRNVSRSMTPGDECRPLVDEAVVDAAGVVVSGICRLEDSAGEGGGNLFEACGD